MPINFDCSNHWQYEANAGLTRTLVYDPDGDNTSVPGCSWSQLSFRQLQMIGNVGIESEWRNFSLPIANFPDPPVVGKYLRDIDGSLWRIKGREKRSEDARWLCACVKKV